MTTQTYLIRSPSLVAEVILYDCLYAATPVPSRIRLFLADHSARSSDCAFPVGTERNLLSSVIAGSRLNIIVCKRLISCNYTREVLLQISAFEFSVPLASRRQRTSENRK